MGLSLRWLFGSILIFSFSAKSFATVQEINGDNSFQTFTFSPDGTETIVTFDTLFESGLRDLETVNVWTDKQKQNFTKSIAPSIKFLFGPLTHRSIGGIKENLEIKIHWEKAFVKNRHVYFPYTYKGLWLLQDQTVNQGSIDLPVPTQTEKLLSKEWLKCTDSDPEHQTESFYWYFWDPTRYGCDHKEGVHYNTVKVSFLDPTLETNATYPEYNRMVRTLADGSKLKSYTFAFGYADDTNSADPNRDSDIGARQYRDFKKQIKLLLAAQNNSTLKSEPIMRGEYDFNDDKTVIGERFSYTLNDIRHEFKIVINSQVDQMNLFAKSFAHDHDGYFAWLGHSRVGSGFDAWQFKSIIENNPDYYSLTKDYQLIYWGGCNSYSYYTLPFFEMKADLDRVNDPNGTKNLDIIANTLPSLFAFNSSNALIQAQALLSSEILPVSYQQILTQTERVANSWGQTVLVVVLGDEDNQAEQ